MAAIEYEWRGCISDPEMVALTNSHDEDAVVGWWDRTRPYSLGWVVARSTDHGVAGFVNVAWDGGDHAFLINTKVRGDLQRRGIGTALVRVAAHHARDAGCDWLHVDLSRTYGTSTWKSAVSSPLTLD